MSNYVYSPSWLRSHLSDPQVVVVDCRFSLADWELGRKKYQESHIPGAYYLDLNLDLSSPVQSHGGRHPLPNPEILAQKLGAMGVDRDTLVVAYDDSRFAFASRLWWLLRYMGHEKVGVLNGGFAKWVSLEYPVAAEIPTPRQGNFTPKIHTDWIVDLETVKASLKEDGVVLIDSRESDRYRGEREPIDPVAGHIPGALNYPWQDASDVNSSLHTPNIQRDRWKELDKERYIIVYCGSGVTACVNLLSLELAAITNAKLYPGSWSDWCSYPELPVKTFSDRPC